MIKSLLNKKGVTLVELLAVVVILGIIAAIAVPTIGNLIANQQEKADQATLQNVIAAAKTYATSEDDLFFTVAEMDEYIDLGSNTLQANGKVILYIEVRGNDVFFYSKNPDEDNNDELDADPTLATSVIVNDTTIALDSGEYVPE